jgi:hypothetical protein
LTANDEVNLYSLIENGIEQLVNKSISVDAQASVDFTPVVDVLNEIKRLTRVRALEDGHFFGNIGTYYNKNNATEPVLLLKGDVTESLYIHFDWFYNDTDNPVTLYSDDANDFYEELITVMPHENIRNLTFRVTGSRVVVGSEGDVKYRTRFWKKLYSDFYKGN